MKYWKDLTILVIEDIEEEALLIKEVLNVKGFTLYLAENVTDGISLLAENKNFDAILLDLTLPDKQGLETFEAIHASATNIPIIVLSSINDEDVVFNTLQKGAQDYLFKGEISSISLQRAIRYSIERKQIELRLKESLDLNNKIFAATTLGMITYKASGECVYANQAAANIINTTIDKLLEQNFHTIESWKKVALYTYACEVIETGLPVQQEINFVTTFGREVWVDFYFTSFISMGEKHLLLILNDKTKKKHIAQALEWKNYLMDMLLQNSPNSIYFKDLEGKITDLSKTTALKFGFNDVKDLIGKTDFDLFSKEHANKTRSDEQYVMTTGNGLYNYEEKETYTNRTETWAETSKMPLFNSDGKLIGTFGISKDITQRKHAEEALLKSKSQLSEAMDIAQLFQWTYNWRDQTICFDERVWKFFGLENIANEPLIMSVSEYFNKYVHPDDRYILEDVIKKARETRYSDYFRQVEYRIIRNDGLIRHINVRISKLQDETAEPIKFYGILQDITDRKIAEEAIKESQKKYESLFEDSPVGVWEEDFSDVKKRIDILKKNGIQDFPEYFSSHPEVVIELCTLIKVNSINKAVLEIYEAKNKNILLNNFQQVFNEQSYKTMALEFALIAEGQRVFDLEQDVITLENTRKSLLIRFSVPEGYEDNLSKVLVSVVDISLRKKAEKELKEYKEHLENLVELVTRESETVSHRNELILKSVGEGIYGINENGNISFINPVALQIVRLNSAQVLGKQQDQVFVFSDLKGNLIPYSKSNIFQTLSDGKSRRVNDEIFIGNNGNTFPVEYIVTPIKERKSIVGAVIVFNDITVRKETETKLLESEQRYRMLADNSTDIIWTIDLDGKITYISPSIKSQTGYSPEEILNLRLEQMFMPDSVQLLRERLVILKAEKDNSREGNFELEQLRKNGTTFWTEVNFNVVNILDTHTSGLICISRDITLKKNLIEELEKSRAAAESATKVKSEFLANISHEIRTPMNSIIGFSELLKTSSLSEKQQYQINAIYSSAKSLLGLINDILDLSKIESGKIKLEFKPIDIRGLLKEIESIFFLNESEVKFYAKIDEKIPETIILDEIRMRQIFFNLVGNAKKFTHTGHISVYIEPIYIDNKQITLKVTVEDTGIGIPLDQQEIIFEAFQQQKGQNINKYGGTGLGLTITKRLVEMMDGAISISSKPGEGSRFEIIFRNVSISGTKIHPKSENNFNPTSIEFDPATILLCDDNQINRKLITNLLEHTSLKIIEAVNGLEAVDLAITNTPALILMDVKMPVMDGIEASQIIKGNELTQNIPIIGLSASIRTLNNSIDIFDDFHLKPIRIKELIEIMYKYLKPAIKNRMADKIVINEAKERLTIINPEFKLILENKILPKYIHVMKNKRLDLMDEFGKLIIEEAQIYNHHEIVELGTDICKFVDNFEIDKLLIRLKCFPQIIKKYKTNNA